MKIFITCFLAFVWGIFLYAQPSGSITPLGGKPAISTKTVFLYKPPKHLLIPANIYAFVVYKKTGEDYFFESIPVQKQNNRYQFEYRPQDSVQVLIMGIGNAAKKMLDNNNGLGYTIYLYGKTNKVSLLAYKHAIDLLSYYARITLQLNKEKLAGKIIDVFETGAKLYPALQKQGTPYNYYLTLLYQVNPEKSKQKILSYAKQMASESKDETKLADALYLYRAMRMIKEYQQVESKALSIFPNGKIARRKFLDDLYEGADTSVESILQKKAQYVSQFNDTSKEMKYTFNYVIFLWLLKEKQYDKLDQYEVLIDQKLPITNLYDYTAKKLSDLQSVESYTELPIARNLSLKSLEIIKSMIRKLNFNQDDGALTNSYHEYIDTYASILYKLGYFDSAVYYQKIICNEPDNSNIKFLEHNVTYLQKVNGDQFAYNYIANLLRSGISSPVMLNQLKTICATLANCDSSYSAIRNQATKLDHDNTIKGIIEKYGSVNGRNFLLKDLFGKEVSIRQFQGKVVVLVFWATWCLPCRESFPSLQKILDNYKNRTDVVFLFIDTWEYITPQKMLANAKAFIESNKYTFEVLLDDQNKVARKYKITSIPYEIIIDKKGEITRMGEELDVSEEIDKAAKGANYR